MTTEYILPVPDRSAAVRDNRIRCPAPCYKPDAATELLLQALLAADLQEKAVCEVGSGTGVVGIAAMGIGARSYTGLDVDRRTIPVAEENVRRCLRGRAESVRLLCSDLFSGVPEGERFDVVTGVVPPILHPGTHLSLFESILLESRVRLAERGRVLLCQRTIYGTEHLLRPFARQGYAVSAVVRKGTPLPPWHSLEAQARAEAAGFPSSLYLDEELQHRCSPGEAIQAATHHQSVFIETAVIEARPV